MTDDSVFVRFEVHDNFSCYILRRVIFVSLGNFRTFSFGVLFRKRDDFSKIDLLLIWCPFSKWPSADHCLDGEEFIPITFHSRPDPITTRTIDIKSLFNGPVMSCLYNGPFIITTTESSTHGRTMKKVFTNLKANFRALLIFFSPLHDSALFTCYIVAIQ
jgi:hypothetical protein